MKVQRREYLDALRHRMHNGLVKIITGIRRSGKSYLLSVLFKEYLLGEGVEEDHIVEVPLDKDEFRDYRDAIALGDYVRSHLVNDGKWNYVFIDEVQLARKVLPKGVDLRRIAPEDRDGAYVSFYDTLNTLRQMANVDVYVTGSNSKTLSSDIDSNFADRGTQIRMHPFSFAEYCEATKAEDHLAAFDQYLIWGGMPLAVAEPDERLRAEYLKNLYSEVYINDIRKRHRLHDDYVLSRLIDVISSATGSLTNPHKLVDTLRSSLRVETSDATIAKYLGYLEDAFLFSKSRRWDVKGKRYFDYPMKYYAEDIGLRNARLDFRDVDPSHAMENAIYNELVRRGCTVDVGVVPVVSVNSDRRQELRYHEIDFVVNRAPGKLYIQSAFAMPTQDKNDQELLPLRRSGDFFRKMVVTAGYSSPRVSDEGIVHVGVIPFLLDRSILDNALKN
ncbi:MAG: ATP-binding protein [Kiritimatiellae bacterium]|nr:ATP-binding protein [Kiritimatiellia bacterium]